MNVIFKAMKQCLLLYFIFSLFGQQLFSQQKEFIFKNFTQEEGLPSNESYFVFEDSRHYIWIATDLGVVRYNGNKFEQFNLPDNVVFKIKEDSKGRIWFFSHKALLAYFENEKMHVYKYNDIIAKRIERIHIIDAMVEDDNSIILNSPLDSNYVIGPNGSVSATRYRFGDSSPSFFTIDHIKPGSCLTRMEKGGSLYADSMFVRVKRGSSLITYPVPSYHYLPFTHYGATSTNGKDIYFFGGKILLKLAADGSFKKLELPAAILSMKIIGDIIWVGMYKNGAAPFTTAQLEKAGNTALAEKSITSINTDYESGYWFTTLENGAYHAKNVNVQHLAEGENTDRYVSRMMSLDDSMLIYSKSSGLYRYSNYRNQLFLPLKNLTTSDLFTDETKTLYYYGAAGIAGIKKINDPFFKSMYALPTPSEVVRVNKDTFIVSRSTQVVLFKSSYTSHQFPDSSYDVNYSRSAKILIQKPVRPFMDAAKNLWAGTNDGLYKTTNAFDTLIKFKPASALLSNGITCIREIGGHILAAGIRANGIALISDTNIIANITEAEGLVSNKIRYLLPLNKQLWAATAKGIAVINFSSFNPVTYSITNIGKDDGFYNVTINQLIQYQQSIVAATSNGLYFIEEPEDFLNRRFPAIPFYVNSISYYKGDTTGISNIHLPYSKRRVAIKFSAVSFNAYETVKYLYRFDHGDSTWHSTTNTELLLENLDAGTYDLQIQAVIPNQQRYSAIQSLTITVEKPWWQNNWLRLLAVILLAAAVYTYITKRVRKIRAEEKKKTELNARLSELEQTALRSQMNPHFIFNCLTSIQQLIVTGNKTDANEYLVKFARLIRKTLDLSAHPFISLREETEYLNEYLFLEQLRLSGHFEYVINIDEAISADKIYIPNMMIQPIVENCIRHGIKSLENRKGQISIHFNQQAQCILCTITDNGVGRTETPSANENIFTKHKSYGVDIVRKRLQAFAEFRQQETGIEINDLFNTTGDAAGTQVVIKLPYKNSL